MFLSLFDLEIFKKCNLASCGASITIAGTSSFCKAKSFLQNDLLASAKSCLFSTLGELFRDESTSGVVGRWLHSLHFLAAGRLSTVMYGKECCMEIRGMPRNLLMDLIYFLFEQESSLDFLLLWCVENIPRTRRLDTRTRCEVASKA